VKLKEKHIKKCVVILFKRVRISMLSKTPTTNTYETVVLTVTVVNLTYFRKKRNLKKILEEKF
jgi:hypothetical protein